MTRFWKIALAVGGVVALWAFSRTGGGEGDEEARPSRRAPGADASGGESDEEESSQEAAGGSRATPETDGGIVRDGRMRGGTWNFAPNDAPAGAPGCLVLRDVPKSSITVDGRTVELRGGFRGFREVPVGTHALELEGYGGTKVQAEVDMPAGGCIVLIYEDSGGPPRLEPDRDWGPQYIGLAMGGAMGQALWPWPDGGEDSGSEE